jgi:phosphatidylserine/phosphatidylglycerophosphate/cardiolipin synthase-like enzyme
MQLFWRVLTGFAVGLAVVPSVFAGERLCDTAHEDCRAPLIELIRQETVGIDVGFWFMEDTRYSTELIRRFQAGVPVRIVFDRRAFNQFGYDAARVPVQRMADAGIPIRHKPGGGGIFHFKMMLFAGQNVVQFSAANYSSEAFVPETPYVNYIDEVIYFSDDPGYVGSFKTRFDDVWTDTSLFANHANVTGPLTRHYPTYPISADLNFVPWQNFATRAVARYKAESVGIDSIMYRITDKRHSDQMIAAVARNVAVRLITEPAQYRDPTRLWHSWNVDRMYMAGVQVRHRGHAGLTHEKLTLLRGQRLAIFGSSNWTSASASGQHENNIFSTRPWFYAWMEDHFARKWNNLGPSAETEPFMPLPPDVPALKSPANAATGQALGVTLRWYAGKWAHKYDLYFGTSPSAMTRIVDDRELGPSQSSSDYIMWSVNGLSGGTTYYWKVVSRTMANMERTSATWSFRTQGEAPAVDGDDILLWAWRSASAAGWSKIADSTGAGGFRMENPNAGAAKQGAALASPAHYFDLSFIAEAGVPYRLWIRGKAAGNSYSNDSVFVQFSDSVNADGAAQWRIGSTSATAVSIEDCSGCGLSGWGWQDNAYGAGALGPLVYFAGSGTHTVRVQRREDGLSIDQITLSRGAHLQASPGAAKNDGTVYPEQGGSIVGPPPPPPPPACDASTLPGGWDTRDIGAVAADGAACFDASAGRFTVDGSGADIWGNADEFRFVYRPLTGDGAIQARVASLENVDAWVKSGVMMRETLAANSRHAMMVVSAGKGLAFQRRASTGGLSVHAGGGAGTAPRWMRLERAGDTFRAYTSSDGSSWTLVGTDTIAMAPAIVVGLPLTSHRDGTVATATIDNVAVTD